jgi:hypothetical protein
VRSAWILGLLLAAGCGARTPLNTGDEDGGQLTLRDAGFDAGRDGGPDTEPDAGPVTPCASDSDCASGVCRARRSFIPADLEPLPLACGEVDPSRAEVGRPCGIRGECDRGICTVSGACVMPCSSTADCPGAERCVEVWVQTSGAAMQPLEACAPVVAAPDDVRVVGPEPGPRLPGEVTADDMLPGLTPSTLVVWTAQDGATPILQEIRDAAGAVVFDGFSGGPDAPAPRWGLSVATVSDAVTLLFPNGPNTPSLPSGFTVALNSFEPSATERIVLQRGGEGAVIDLDAYLVGGGGWATSGGAVPRPLARAIDDANEVLAQVGLSIGEVRVHSIVGRLRRDFEVLEGSSGRLSVPSELAPMYRLTAGARRPSVHVFFVRMIDGAAGIASGIPGPHAVPGTGASGVAIAVDVIPEALLGLVMVHEVGHYMGLFHTSELDGTVNDPLPDTGECRIDRDLDGDGLLVRDECRGTGAGNVMFWAGEAPALSAQQGTIMRRALFVR